MSLPIWLLKTPLLLEQISASLLAGYTTRRIKSGQLNPIRVRESGGSAESDIGFSGVGLNQTMLESFCSGVNGFITTMYDVQETNDVTQAVAANQPQIVSAGSMLANTNGTPRIAFDGAASYLQDAALSNPQPYWLSAIIKQVNPLGTVAVCESGNLIYSLRANVAGVVSLLTYNGSTFDTLVGSGNLSGAIHQVDTLVVSGSTSAFVQDATQTDSGTFTQLNWSDAFAIGGRINGTGRFWEGDISEILIFTNPSSGDRTIVRDDQSTYWGTP